MRTRILSLVGVLALLNILVGCSGPKRPPKAEMTVLVRMMPAQQRFFAENVIKKFEVANNCKINIATFENEWDLPKKLSLDAQKTIGLVKVPFELTRELAENGFILPLTQIVDSTQLNYDLGEYHQLACGLGYINNVPYYIPRKLETRIMFYRRSKVEAAIGKFETYKMQIAADLKKQNGFGLPKDYSLENDPAEWDYYDIFVVGYIWSHEEYNGVKMGRLAHRGAKYGGTALGFVDGALQMGATHDEILKLNTQKVEEVFLWENVLIRNGLYNPGMWQDPWRGSDLYNGIKDGKIFLTFLQQIDCFLVHGWEDDPSMPSYMPDPDDMGLTVMPKAVSFDLDRSGVPTIEGTKKISSGGWWWGIPKTSPNIKLAYALARYITSKEVQAEECSKFGMIPVRKDILSNLPQVFEEGWVGDIFKTSVDQMKLNEFTTVPLVKEYPSCGENMINLWYKLCVEYDTAKKGPMTLKSLDNLITKDFVPRQKEILGAHYPK